MRFYLTTAIDYVNSRPHLGTAYEKITADVIARYKRLAGFDTHFLMGNDEHSQNVYEARREPGMRSARRTATEMEQEFRDVWAQLDISFDDFIRTTEPRHRARRAEAGAGAATTPATSTRASTRAGTASRCEAFKQEKDLVDGLCPIHPTTDAGVDPREELLLPPVEVPRPPAARTSRRIRSSSQPESRRNEILRLLEGGLEDISVSRAGQRGASRCRSTRRASSTSGSTR